ncbi:hypothetical protein Tco_0652660 [Tanacetum coccineum]|uniref:Uncharacterized protein n=1 Tax=Tanacetum coccineum TaxID=301880 RepID=A0ABQ4WY88_9ASTR
MQLANQRLNKLTMHMREEKVDMRDALRCGLVVTEDTMAEENIPALNLTDEMNRSFIAQNSYRLERETFSKIYRRHSLHQQNSSSITQLFWILWTHDAKTGIGKSISLTEAEEEAVAREVHATHARIVSESEPEPTQRRQSEAADIMKALRKQEIEQRQPELDGSKCEGTSTLLGVLMSPIVVSRASSEGLDSKKIRGFLMRKKLFLRDEMGTVNILTEMIMGGMIMRKSSLVLKNI